MPEQERFYRARFRVGQWLVDPTDGSLECRGKTTRLEPKSMETLLFLARRPGLVTGKEEILSEVWPDTFVSDVALTRTVHQIRQALGDDVKSPRYIETVHKRGYRLIAPVVWVDREPRAKGGPLLRAGMISLCLLLPILVAWLFFGEIGERDFGLSIAVLPFENLSDDRSDEYFADGISEEIITRLSAIRALRVVSRSSCMLYKDRRSSVTRIAEELRVTYVLEGTVRREGSRLRITAQLIDARTDQHVWSNVYDNEATGIFEIQIEVAKLIASALDMQLSTAEWTQIEKNPTSDLSAYDFYLKGREYYLRYRDRDNENAIALFEQALDLDEHFALAYAGLADCYGQKAYQFGYPATWIDSAIEMGNRAVSLDPNSAEGHKSLGMAYALRGKLREALNAYRQALVFNPNYYPAISNMAVILEAQGEFAKAMELCIRSLALNPRSPVSSYNIGDLYLDLHDLERAEEWYDRALDLDPDYAPAHSAKTWIHICRGNYAKALEQGRQALAVGSIRGWNAAGDTELYLGTDEEASRSYKLVLESAPKDWNASLGYSLILLRKGFSQEAGALLEPFVENIHTALENGNESARIRRNLAAIYAVQGKQEAALDWLEKAGEMGWRPRPRDLIAPEFESLQAEAGFGELMSRLNSETEKQRLLVDQLVKD